MLISQARTILDESLRTLLSRDELETFRLTICDYRSPSRELPGSQLISVNDQAVVQVQSEEFKLWLNPDESEPALRQRGVSEFQDFVAESSFGWGQNRVGGDAPA